MLRKETFQAKLTTSENDHLYAAVDTKKERTKVNTEALRRLLSDHSDMAKLLGLTHIVEENI